MKACTLRWIGAIAIAIVSNLSWASEPSTPQNLETSLNGSTLELSWSPSTDNTAVAGYNVYLQDRYIDTVQASFYQLDIDTTIDNVFYVVAFDAPEPGEPIRFSLKSERLLVPSRDTPEVSDIPTAPSNLLAVRESDTQVSVSWDASTDNDSIAGYNVYRDDQYITTIFTTLYNDISAIPGQSHTYYIVAFDEPRNFSPKSELITVASTSANNTDSGGTDGATSSTDSDTGSDGSSGNSTTQGADAGSTDASSDGQTETTSGTDTTSSDTGSDTGGTDTTDGADTAGATDSNTTSSDSGTSDATTGSDGTSTEGSDGGSTDAGPDNNGQPSIPTNVIAGIVTLTAIEVLWDAAQDDGEIVGYNVYRDNQYITTVFAPQFIDDNLPSSDNTSVSYHVVAYDDDLNFSDPSQTLTVTKATQAVDPLLPPPPQNLRVTLISNDWVALQWDPVPGIDTYNLYRNDTLLHTISPDELNSENQRYADSYSYIDCNYTRAYERCIEQSPQPGVPYTYRVSAVDAELNESLASYAVVTQLLENERSVIDPSEFELRFAEEFDSAELDVSVWNTRLPWGPETFINGEMQYFVDHANNPNFGYNPFNMTGDTLSIEGVVTPDALLTSAGNQPYLSGAITTRESFTMTYGYVEARARFAQGIGTLSSFFLFHQWFALNAPEIDIVEFLGQTPDTHFQTYHYHDELYPSVLQSSPTMFTQTDGVDFTEDFHTYSVLWEPNLVVWFIDGEEVRRMTGPEVSRQRMYITAYLVMGSEWVPAPDVTSDIFPASYELDYIRAYQRSDNTSYENTSPSSGR
ncbi:MAG: family 16 glycosylhydrolase [Gammaproteobacteria bacterium]|nr:family 16 glycosylhydrolase [Gammaproteobacteria bacterium]